jgi:hypothetical protein
MKIGIMTFWWSNDNYGQLLQCYALQKYLRNLGYEAFLIRYKHTEENRYSIRRLIKIFSPLKVVKYFTRQKRLEKISKEPNRHFESFRSEYLVQSSKLYISYDELKRNPPDADCYIAGSDQIWNYWNNKLNYYKNAIHAYFLDFGSDKIKRLSYAASWGGSCIPNEYIKEITPLLKRFDYVSVREESGIELCKECGYDSAECVCDPTLLLSAEYYRNLYNENPIRKIDKKYLLVYMLSNEIDLNKDIIKKFASENNLKIINISIGGVFDDFPKYYATIPEWLYLIDNAEYIITNSFHGSVFCTIFHKQFGIVPRITKFSYMNDRFEMLFKLLGLKKRYITNNDLSILKEEYTEKSISFSNGFISELNQCTPVTK